MCSMFLLPPPQPLPQLAGPTVVAPIPAAQLGQIIVTALDGEYRHAKQPENGIAYHGDFVCFLQTQEIILEKSLMHKYYIVPIYESIITRQEVLKVAKGGAKVEEMHDD